MKADLGEMPSGNFSYSYKDGKVECEFFGSPFTIDSRGLVYIGDESFILASGKIIVVGTDNMVMEYRDFNRDKATEHH